ncbi:MAG: cupin domain-containing protein [Cytophagaceae bacterium]|nr:cupin domain-containing protein [Cytophagaceae bacterium]MBL0327648.1 cupin domain-containing protein [Cytophagaceae bacterium]
MKIKIIIILLSIVYFSTGCNKKLASKKQTESIFPIGNKVSNQNFIGDVYVKMFAQNDSIYNVTMGNVTFEPGARTNWHYHPGGQILIITDGVGYYQEKESPIKIIKKGDVVQCPPNIQHWHGASPTQSVTHIAISTNTNFGGAVWLRPVSDKEYTLK